MRKRQLLWLLLAALVLAGCSSLWDRLAPASAQVTLHVFSGRPDPAWSLTAAQAQDLLALVETMPEGEAAGEPARLGYRGVTVEFQHETIQEMRAFDGHARIETGDETLWLDDPGRVLETWLLDTAGDALEAELVSQVRAGLDQANAASETISAEGFAIYLPVEEGLSPAEVAQADLSALALQEEPIIKMDDIVAYHASSHTFELTEEAVARLAGFQVPVTGIPFVVSVDGDPVYPGAFWTALSSGIYQESVVIINVPGDRALLGREIDPVLSIDLGYPAWLEGYHGSDDRSDSRILNAFKEAGKLR